VKSLSTSSISNGTSYSTRSTDTTLHMISRLGSDSVKLEVTSSSSLGRSFLMVDKGRKIISVAGLFTIIVDICYVFKDNLPFYDADICAIVF